MMRTIWLVLAGALGCASTPHHGIPTARFHNAPATTVVDDRRDVPKQPRPRRALLDYYGYNAAYERLVTRALEVPRHQRAHGVNALDEVPNSTWFTNRGELTPEQVAAGPTSGDSPELHLPWTIQSTGYSGTSIAFIILDSRGVKYQLKFDDIAHPEMETAADAVVDRLMWACGYNVPEDHVVYFRRDELLLARDAQVKGNLGSNLRPLEARDVEEKLHNVAREPDGRIRGLTSRWIEGKALGPPPVEGVRKDDPNDRIPHELRRDVRGMYAIYAWLDMVDIVPGNFLDVYTSDASAPNVHYVKHYSLDFGQSLGVMGDKLKNIRNGYSYRFDWGEIFYTIVNLGIVQPDWEKRPRDIEIRGVSSVFSPAVDVGSWKPGLPFVPFQDHDRFDGFWGAKIVAGFTREQIRAAVEAGRYSDPRAVEYMTNTIIARQRRVADYFYHQVAPLDGFTAEDNLCFDDLAIEQGYTAPAQTRYVISTHDMNGQKVSHDLVTPPAASGHTCMKLPSLAPDKDSYTIFEITTTRPDFTGKTFVHVARDQQGTPRVIGVWRA